MSLGNISLLLEYWLLESNKIKEAPKRVLMARFKSPMRKWLCFGLSFISIAYID